MAEEKAPPTEEITENDKLMGLLAYVISLIVPLIILLSETGKQRAFQKYHAIHSLALSVVYFMFALLLCIPACIVEAFTGVGILCFIPLYILPYIAMIYCGIQAYQGKYFTIPVITDFIKKQGWV